MENLMTATIAIGILLSFFAQLEEQAVYASDLALNYTESMTQGLDCVLDNKLLVECNPELFSNEELKGALNNLNHTITENTLG